MGYPSPQSCRKTGTKVSLPYKTGNVPPQCSVQHWSVSQNTRVFAGLIFPISSLFPHSLTAPVARDTEILQPDFQLETLLLLQDQTGSEQLPLCSAAPQTSWKRKLCFARRCLHSASTQGNGHLQSSLGQQRNSHTSESKNSWRSERRGKRSGAVSKFVTQWEKQTLCPRFVFCLAGRQIIPATGGELQGNCRVKGDINAVLEQFSCTCNLGMPSAREE